MQGMKIWHLEKDPGEVLSSGRVDRQLNTVIFSRDMRQIITGGRYVKKRKQLQAKQFNVILEDILKYSEYVDNC